MLTPIILSGGSGTRLWPLSRQLYPKQLINLVDDNTLLQNTLLRLNGLERVSGPMVVCNEDHRFMVAEQIRQINAGTADIILEPVGRNTAPAIAVAALKTVQTDPDAVLLVLPADHVLSDIPAFHAALDLGYDLACQNRMITFGIVPDSPETGYGYICKGRSLDDENKAFALEAFVEKPDRQTAETYLASGQYYWNSGIFMFKASTVLDEMAAHSPAIVDACRNALENSRQDLDFLRLDTDAFSASPSDSIDYAVMEKTNIGAVIPLSAGWNDLGSWEALWQTGQRDDLQNVIHGDVLMSNVTNSYLHAESRLVAAVGLENHVVVETKDAVLVASRDRVQDVKQLVNQLKTNARPESATHSKVFRPWGDYETIDMSDRYQVKRITVKPGAKLSLQKHFHRAEHWTVVSGTAIVTREDEQITLKEDQSTYIPLGAVHRLENPGKIQLELIEVQSGSYLEEDDIVRFDDVYGRQN